MRKIITAILFFFAINVCYAGGCSYTEDMMRKNSEKYGKLLKISIEKIEIGYGVNMSVPFSIEDSELQQAYVVKKDWRNDKEIFVFPISMYQENKQLNGWFNISEDLFPHIALYLDYGEGCGFTIRKAIKH